MTKAEKTKYNQALAKIEKLEKDLKNSDERNENYRRQYQEAQKEIDSIHAALDTLPGIPSKKAKIDEYNTVSLTLNARLFAWISHVAFGGKIIIKESE